MAKKEPLLIAALGNNENSIMSIMSIMRRKGR
jgi:hypothetical protein